MHHHYPNLPSPLQVVFSNKASLPSMARLFVGPKQQGPFELACPEPLPLPPRTKQQLLLSADSIGQHRFLKIAFTGTHQQGQGALTPLPFHALNPPAV